MIYRFKLLMMAMSLFVSIILNIYMATLISTCWQLSREWELGIENGKIIHERYTREIIELEDRLEKLQRQNSRQN